MATEPIPALRSQETDSGARQVDDKQDEIVHNYACLSGSTFEAVHHPQEVVWVRHIYMDSEKLWEIDK